MKTLPPRVRATRTRYRPSSPEPIRLHQHRYLGLGDQRVPLQVTLEPHPPHAAPRPSKAAPPSSPLPLAPRAPPVRPETRRARCYRLQLQPRLRPGLHPGGTGQRWRGRWQKRENFASMPRVDPANLSTCRDRSGGQDYEVKVLVAGHTPPASWGCHIWAC